MDLQLKGKTALILGGSKGLGRGVADALAAEGVAVALVARGQEALDRAVSEITSRDAKAVGFAADLANWPSLEDAANAARRQLGAIDILLNNSGGPPPSGVVGVSAKVWEEQFNAMVLPLFRITDLLIGDMRARKWGRIINVASTSVVEPIAAIGVSNTLRSAVIGWAKTLATEVARDGVTVNTILPGAIATDRTLQLSRAAAERQKISVEEAMQRGAQAVPVGRIGTPVEFGALAAFLASPLAAYITGTSIRIDGGASRSV
jgi:3-oxoacyl-[acyl-carrier protein] reductase